MIRGLETYSVAVFSTAHIRKSDAEFLEDEAVATRALIVRSDEHKYNVYAGEVDFSEVKARGGSDELCALIQAAQAHGCRYVDLDQDGPGYPQLPSFEW